MRPRPSRRTALVGAAVVVVALLVGLLWLRDQGRLGGDDGLDRRIADYCADVTDRRAELGAALAAGPQTGLLRALPTFEKLAEKAPENLQQEWSVVLEAIGGLRDALAAAGQDPADYDPQQPPEALSEADSSAIEAAGLRLAALETRRAFADVAQQARDVCKTPLSL